MITVSTRTISLVAETERMRTRATVQKSIFVRGGLFFFFFFFTPLNQLTFKIDYFILHLVLMKKIFVEIWHGKRYAEREMTRETNGN